MSMRQTPEATIAGLEGPLYPPGIKALAAALGSGHSGMVLEQIGAKTPGFRDGTRLRSTDGYLWFYLMRYSIKGSNIWVALPWSSHGEKSDGGPLDRSPAVYLYDGGADLVAQVLSNLTSALRAYKPNS